jgi:tetratricopeptide (TPR) repeat protein
LKIDSLANYSRINLSAIYNGQGKNDKALLLLNEALRIDPANPRISYNLALLNVELGKKDDALKCFEKAYQLKYDFDGMYYNYALYLQQVKNNKKAEILLNEGLKKYPYSEQLNYGGAYYFLQANKMDRATECIRKLKEINPTDEKYSELFKLIKS